MSAINDILASLPIDQLAGQLGAEPDAVRDAASQAVTGLLGGMQRNAQDQDGELSLAGALNAHADDPVLAGGSVNLDQVDLQDGEKIVGHILGASPDQAAYALGGQGAGNTGLLGRLLPLLAPIVMAYLAQKLTRTGQGNVLPTDKSGGGILGSILGGILGGGQGQAGGGLSIEDILGGVLGGQRQDQATAQAPQQSPFQVPDQAGSDRPEPTMRLDPQAEAEQDQQPQQAPDGGLLGKILGGLFGKSSR